MLYIIEILISALMAYLMSLFLIPALKNLAFKINLVDKPNHRKIHLHAVPLVGGIAVLSSVALSLSLHPLVLRVLPNYMHLIGATIILLVTGVIDDKFDIKAKQKLIVQLACSYMMALGGYRITSLYGLFGIESIPVAAQYLLTIILITGVVNAFNLMDGIDGLAGGLSIIGFSILSILSYVYSDHIKLIIYMAFIGALIGFLKFNLNSKKIFMGDAGSLVLGFILVSSGIETIEKYQTSTVINPSLTLFIIVGFFSVPVLDSLRVYLVRIKKGHSPFRADKSHLHHLFLLSGLSPKKISLLINVLVVVFLLSSVVLTFYFSKTIIFFVITAFFYLLSKILSMNKKMQDWKQKLNQLEKN